MKRTAATPGAMIVLTADDSLMAPYALLFDGMLAASQTTTTPWPLMRRLMPRAGRATVAAAPLGLRRIEAALLAGDFAPATVRIVPRRDLGAAIGPQTRIVGISSGEPAGHGMNSSTMTGISGGTIYAERLFRSLLSDVRQRVARQAPHAKVVLGGPGAWQLGGTSPAARKTASVAAAPAEFPPGIDHVVTGYAEGNIAELFRAIAAGAAPPILEGRPPPAADIPALRGPTTMGAIELSRGCGFGCSFCTLAAQPMQHVPPQTILSDAQVNLAAGRRNLALLSEDIFRYGATGCAVDPGALIRLLERMRRLDGLGLLQCDHAGIASAARWPDAELGILRQQIVGATGQRFPWLNFGVETASGALLHRHCAAKMDRTRPDDWAALCEAQLRRLCRAGFFPLVSLVLNLPGETETDLRQTQRWVARIADLPLAVFPVRHAPLEACEHGPPPLHRRHWDLIRACYRINFRRMPGMVWDNQTAAGRSMRARLETRLLAAAGTQLWTFRLARRVRAAPPRDRPGAG